MTMQTSISAKPSTMLWHRDGLSGRPDRGPMCGDGCIADRVTDRVARYPSFRRHEAQKTTLVGFIGRSKNVSIHERDRPNEDL